MARKQLSVDPSLFARLQADRAVRAKELGIGRVSWNEYFLKLIGAREDMKRLKVKVRALTKLNEKLKGV